MPRIEIKYSTEDGLHIGFYTSYKEADKTLLQPFRDELNSLPEVKNRIIARGCATDDEILKEYLICRYGGNDNVIDINEGTHTPDYCHCGGRGYCKDEGFEGLCSIATVGDARLSKVEVQDLQLVAQDKSVKEIASIRNRSRHTIEAEARSIREKLKVCSIAAAAALATSLGIVRT